MDLLNNTGIHGAIVSQPELAVAGISISQQGSRAIRPRQIMLILDSAIADLAVQLSPSLWYSHSAIMLPNLNQIQQEVL